MTGHSMRQSVGSKNSDDDENGIDIRGREESFKNFDRFLIHIIDGKESTLNPDGSLNSINL